MTEETTHVLASIDGALRDYGTSGDAMRWTPEPADGDWALVSMRITVDPEQLWAAVNATMNRLVASFEQMRPVAEATGRSMTKLSGFMGAHYLCEGGWRETSRQHRNHCPRCNPAGNPPPEAGHYKPGPKAARIRRRR